MARRAVLLAALALPAACASPKARYWRLNMVPGQQQPGGPAKVEIRAVQLAAYLDRNSIVRGGAENRVEVLDNDLWAAPLGDMTTAVLVDDLSQRLPGSNVFRDGAVLSDAGGAVVEVALQRFEADGSGQVVVQAQLSVRLPGSGGTSPDSVAAPPQIRIVQKSLPLEGSGVPATTAALSRALAQVADAAAVMLATPR